MKKKVLRERRKIQDAQNEENASKEEIRHIDAPKTPKRERKSKNA